LSGLCAAIGVGDSRRCPRGNTQILAVSIQRSAISYKEDVTVKDFRGLQVWHKAHALTLAVYRLTAAFPKYKLYGLTSQIRRAAASIPTNIAEGCGRHGDAELSRFLQIAMGSASEVEYQALLARDLTFINANQYEDVANHVTEVKRMITGLIQKLRAER
jgi:four helix bundle protein